MHPALIAGPCVSTDTACSSSLVATHLAHTGLVHRETTAAVAGGVNTMLSPVTTVAICQLQALSPVGRCRSFDSSGDGYGRGEGFAVALLSQARPGQRALALVCSSAVNQDGQSSGLTAPNGPSQTKLVINALRQGSLAAAALRFVAVHGTGTPLGDPIEVGALGQALRGSSSSSSSSSYQQESSAPPPVVLGSVKSCYGHTEGAAGLTGLLMAAQAASQRCAAPVMHLRSINPYVEAALGDWHKGSGHLAGAIPRQQAAAPQAATLAGTSSFGMSGVNAHVIVSAPADSTQLLHSEAGAAAGKCLLHSQRLWPLPAAHPLLRSTLAAAGQALFSCALAQPALSFLWQQHAAGQPTLLAMAVLELAAAAGRSLSDAAVMPAVAQAALTAPIHCQLAVEVRCAIHLGSGTVEVLAGGQACAHAYLLHIASASLLSQCSSQAGGSALASMLLLPLQALTASPGSIAGVAAPAVQQAGDYCCHPAMAQAAVDLDTLHAGAAVLGCQLYLPAGTRNALSGASASASSGCLALACTSGPVAWQLQGMVSRPLAEMRAERIAAAPHSPAWQLIWQPAEFVGVPPAAPAATTCLIISTQPCTLSSLCSCSGLEAENPPLVALNAVWASAGSGIDGSNVQPGAELCVSSEAHLEALLQSMQPQQCFFVHPPRAAVSTTAALATYGAVSRWQGDLRLSLVTYDQAEIASFACQPHPDVALLQGRRLHAL